MRFFGAASAQRTLLLWVIVLVTSLAIWDFLGEGAPPRTKHAYREPSAERAEPSEGGEASDVDSSP
jgi:hypothetical protein